MTLMQLSTLFFGVFFCLFGWFFLGFFARQGSVIAEDPGLSKAVSLFVFFARHGKVIVDDLSLSKAVIYLVFLLHVRGEQSQRNKASPKQLFTLYFLLFFFFFFSSFFCTSGESNRRGLRPLRSNYLPCISFCTSGDSSRRGLRPLPSSYLPGISFLHVRGEQSQRIKASPKQLFTLYFFFARQGRAIAED